MNTILKATMLIQTPTMAPIDRAAFENLLRLHHRALLAYARALTSAGAEDLVQESLLAAYGKRDEFDASRPFRPWIRGFIRLKYLESAKRRRELFLDGTTLDTIEDVHRLWDVTDANEPFELIEALRDCVRRLQASYAE